MPNDDPTPGLIPPSWVDRIREVRLIELIDKYRARLVHPKTGLPFEPSRQQSAFTIESLAFQTGAGFQLALRLFIPTCVIVFALSFLWDWHGLVRSCSVAGMIGFGTNWVAIKMLFRPRHPRPVFGHGLIPSQRQDLIDKVATEVLNNLINEELILERIDQMRIVPRFSSALIERLRQVTHDPEFKADLRDMMLTYVGQVTADPAFRRRLANRVSNSLEEFAGERFSGWLVRRLRDVWRGPVVDVLNAELERLEETLGEGMEHMDQVVERLPAALEEREEQIDRFLSTVLVGLVREVDVHAIVYEQLSTVTADQLETGFREFSDDKLSYITLLGGIFGVIGGTVIVFPLPAVATIVVVLGMLALLDVVLHRFLEWRRRRAS